MQIGETMPDFRDPIAALMACHRRIERTLHALTRVGRLVAVRRGDAGDMADAIEAGLRHFRVAAVIHTADEEESLVPKLRARLKDPESHFAYLLGHLESDHRELEELHRGFAASAARVADGLRGGGTEDEGLAAAGREYREKLGLMRAIYRSHIRVEDGEIYRAARAVLAPMELAQLGAEMAARRGIDVAETPAKFMAAMGVG